MLKSYRVVGFGGVGGPVDFSVSLRPLGFGFSGFWVWGLGLTIICLFYTSHLSNQISHRNQHVVAWQSFK